jgi:Protein of unknown function (DUF2934)
MHYPIVVRERPVEAIPEYEIRRRAYDLFLQRGRVDGNDVDDWLKAEYQLTRQMRSFGWGVGSKN